MARDLKCEMQGGVLVARVSGDFALDQSCNTFLEILKAMDIYKADKVLVDCLQVRGAPSTMERFSYAKFGSDELWKLLLAKNLEEVQLAYVGTDPLMDKDHFGQTVATNRGVNVKTFDNVAAAISWLGTHSKGK
jgi:hypothetical protein